MKQFNITVFGCEYEVWCEKNSYRDGDALAITVWSLDEEFCEPAPFGTLTVNIRGASEHLPEDYAFVKNWGENEEWADKLAEAIGGKRTDVVVGTGYVRATLWDFRGLSI